MYIQLRQSVFLLRNIKIYGISTTFHSKKSTKRKPNQMVPTVGITSQ